MQQQNEVGGEPQFLLFCEDSRRGMMVPYLAGNGTRVHKAGIRLAPEPSANGVHGVMCTCGLAKKTKRAAAFKTDCNRSKWFPATPVRTALLSSRLQFGDQECVHQSQQGMTWQLVGLLRISNLT